MLVLMAARPITVERVYEVLAERRGGLFFLYRTVQTEAEDYRRRSRGPSKHFLDVKDGSSDIRVDRAASHDQHAAAPILEGKLVRHPVDCHRVLHHAPPKTVVVHGR